MQGAFEAVRCDGSRAGMSVRQMAPVKPIEWQDDSDPSALLGDTSWKDYTVSADVLLEQRGAVELLGRANQQNRPQSHQAAYLLRAGRPPRFGAGQHEVAAA